MSNQTPTERRRDALKKAEACVCQDRQSSYGDAEDNFARIAALASVALADRLKRPLDAVDVALFMACVKLGRLAYDRGNLDSWVDLAGYAACGAGIVTG